jgi:hypothetical protein
MLESSGVATQLAASEEGLSSISDIIEEGKGGLTAALVFNHHALKASLNLDITWK